MKFNSARCAENFRVRGDDITRDQWLSSEVPSPVLLPPPIPTISSGHSFHHRHQARSQRALYLPCILTVSLTHMHRYPLPPYAITFRIFVPPIVFIILIIIT